MPALLALLLLLGGGVVSVADQSLPGDILYPIKINFSEEVLSLLAVTDLDNAQWEVTAAERRLQEAEALTEEGTLDEATRIMLENEFSEHIANVSVSTENLVMAGELAAASDVALTLESALSAHARIISSLLEYGGQAVAAAGNVSGDGITGSTLTSSDVTNVGNALEQLAEIAIIVNNKLEEVAIVREAVDVQLLEAADKADEAEALARSREKSADEKVRSIRDRLTARRASKGEKESIATEEQLLASENALDRGRAATSDKDFISAYKNFQEAVKMALEGDAFLRADEDGDKRSVTTTTTEPTGDLPPVGDGITTEPTTDGDTTAPASGDLPPVGDGIMTEPSAGDVDSGASVGEGGASLPPADDTVVTEPTTN